MDAAAFLVTPLLPSFFAAVEWWNGGMAEWRNGRVAEWRNGGMAERNGGTEWWNGIAERNGRQNKMAGLQGTAEWQKGYIPNLPDIFTVHAADDDDDDDNNDDNTF